MNRSDLLSSTPVAVPGPKPSDHVHRLIGKVARAVCAETYELIMRNDKVYSAWKRQNPDLQGPALQAAYVARFWGGFITPARATLAHMLEGPLPEASKAEIYEALLADNTLGRQPAARYVIEKPLTDGGPA